MVKGKAKEKATEVRTAASQEEKARALACFHMQAKEEVRARAKEAESLTRKDKARSRRKAVASENVTLTTTTGSTAAAETALFHTFAAVAEAGIPPIDATTTAPVLRHRAREQHHLRLRKPSRSWARVQHQLRRLSKSSTMK